MYEKGIFAIHSGVFDHSKHLSNIKWRLDFTAIIYQYHRCKIAYCPLLQIRESSCKLVLNNNAICSTINMLLGECKGRCCSLDEWINSWLKYNIGFLFFLHYGWLIRTGRSAWSHIHWNSHCWSCFRIRWTFSIPLFLSSILKQWGHNCFLLCHWYWENSFCTKGTCLAMVERWNLILWAFHL